MTSSSIRPRTVPSLADVAVLAGVSPQTVSRVSRGGANVHPKTRDRVLAAMEKIGYAPNTAARALRLGSFGTIGLIARRISRTGEAGVVQGVVKAAQARGSAVTLLDVEDPAPGEVATAVARLREQSIDGLIIVSTDFVDSDAIAVPDGLPVAVANSYHLGHDLTVSTDEADGTRRAVEHLLALGHRTVHHIGGPPGSGPARAREAAWRDALTAAGRVVPAPLTGDWTSASGYAAGRRLLRHPGVTAVFCANDETAAGFLRACHEAGRRVPEDISVVGFDNTAFAGDLWPPLTTVALDFEAQGRALVELLWQQMSGAPRDHPLEPVPVELVVRRSTGPAPGAGPAPVR